MPPITNEVALDILKKPTNIPQAFGMFIEIKPEYESKYTEDQLIALNNGEMLPISKLHVSSACAMGLVGLKTGTAPTKLNDVLSFYGEAIELNDDENLSFSEIAFRIEHPNKDDDEEDAW